MFDKKDPVTMAIITLVVSFVLLVGILYLARPVWVQIVDPNTGKNLLSWNLVVAYSATFAFVCAIAAMLMISNHRGPTATKAYSVDAIYPVPAMASAYCGIKHKA